MSTREAPPSARRAVQLAVRVGLPLAILAVVIAVFLGERMTIDHELSLAIPDAAAPGSSMPARALLFDRLEMPDGPRLTSAPVELSLVDRDGRVRARATLVASAAGGAEGAIDVPRELSGWIDVVAVARQDGEAVASVHTALEVRRDPPGVEPQGRIAGDLQRLELGPVTGAAPPSALEVRVVGGACVPEERCEVLVHVGEPAASVALAPAPSVTSEPRGAETSGLVLLPVVVHGPEAHVELVATRGGEEVARRPLRLPVALATPALDIPDRALDGGERPHLRARVLGDRPAILVEAFRAGRWERTGSFAASERATPLPFELSPGLWHLQVHTDPFSAERSAVRLVELGERAIAADAPPGPDALRFAWSAAAHEEAIYPLPDGVSGRAEDLARLEARQRTLRIAAVIALVLGLLVAAVLFSLRGLEAAQEAQAVMEATGDPELASARHRRRTLLSALALVATTLLAFLGAAAIVVARAHLFE